ncbi:F-box/kelch-repeat protein At1g16250-like [Magnolia sinica]|uniref:F-box/kelch-repeat protein At1g16250-like n=1 Tax=Magnolia sinica TaxID=86752 RepID=UPI00265A091D|nr:F-box/kelch-repeat protein At1g16250-like [Magnolia sinica]
MGSLPSPPHPLPSTENSASDCRVYASFCSRSPTPGPNTCNWMESYNPSDNTWRQIGTIPGLADNHVLKGFAMVAIRDAVYIIGGRLCRKEGGDGCDDAIEVDVAVLTTVLRYNVQTNEWAQCVPLGTPRFDFACTVCDDKIYVAGGKCTLACERGIRCAEVYDPALDEWNCLPNMSTLRYKCAGVTWQGKIYVVGGFAEMGDSDKTVPFRMERSSAEAFDTRRGEWDLMRGMWQLDVPPNQIVAVNDRLYSSGDCLNTWKGHIEAYDGKLNIWNIVERSHLKNLSSPFDTTDANESGGGHIHRVYLTMAPVGAQLYFLAGYRLPGELFRSMSAVHTFDTSAAVDAWRSFEPMEEEMDKELCSHCCVVRVS